MASTIKVDKLEGSTGSTITVPTGQSLTLTDGLAVSSLPVVTVAKGGTNLSSFTAGDVLYATGSTTLAKLPKGTAEQVLAMNSGATAPDWGSLDITVCPTITVAKGGTGQAGGFTQGDFLYATGATTLAKLAKGTALQQIRMNAGATAPEWTTIAAASSDVVKLANITATSGTTVDIDGHFTADYKLYKIYIHDFVGSASWHLFGRYLVGGSADAGTYYAETNFRSYTDGSPSNSVTAYGDWDSENSWAMTTADSTNSTNSEGGITGEITIHRPLNTTQWKHMQWYVGHKTAGNTLQMQGGNFLYKNTNAISGLRLYPNTGTIDLFDATIYGIK